jgi:hypothetical protein
VTELRNLVDMMPEGSGTVAEELDTIVIPDGPDKGQNALIKAVRNNQPRCAELLLQAGASPMDGGYAFSGHYDQFFTSTGEEEATVENLRKATLEEARRSARLAEVAVEGISGLTQVLSDQINELATTLASTQRFAKDSSDANAELLQKVSQLSPTKRS